MDVDGTLTDGKIYMGEQGEVFKAFSVKDGLGIGLLLPRHGILPVIITGRKSVILTNRCREMNINEIHQGIDDKSETLRAVAEKYNCDFSQIAYIGDDENDYECMEMCGVKGCPADSAESIKLLSDYVCLSNGGEGAVREFVEWLIGTVLD